MDVRSLLCFKKKFVEDALGEKLTFTVKDKNYVQAYYLDGYPDKDNELVMKKSDYLFPVEDHKRVTADADSLIYASTVYKNELYYLAMPNFQNVVDGIQSYCWIKASDVKLDNSKLPQIGGVTSHLNHLCQVLSSLFRKMVSL